MEDNLKKIKNVRRPKKKQKTTYKRNVDNLKTTLKNGRRPKKMEDNIKKSTLFGCDIIVN